MTTANPTRDEFAALLEESFGGNDVFEGAVVKGTITAIEKDLAVIHVGLKVEGRVPLREFGAKAKDGTMKPGDTVEVMVKRIENAMAEPCARDSTRPPPRARPPPGGISRGSSDRWEPRRVSERGPPIDSCTRNSDRRYRRGPLPDRQGPEGGRRQA